MIKKTFAVLFLLTLIPPLDSFAEKKLILGGKNFTEQYILTEMAAVLLEQQAFDVTLKTGIGSTLLRKSLETSQVDLYFEYTGTAYTVYHKQKDRYVMCDPEKVFVAVKHTDAQKGLIWLPPLGFNNTYTLLMQKARAGQLGIGSISDLGKYVNSHPNTLIFGMNPEFWERPDGFKSLMKAYGFRVPVKKIKKMATGICYTALKERKTDISMGFSTDGRVIAFGFVSIIDDKKFFPVYHPAPVVRKEVLDKYPEIRDILNPMVMLNTKEMRSLNAAVDIEKKPAEKVATEWLKEKGILK
jgi:osmoprotectant transport system substrate-binding protein